VSNIDPYRRLSCSRTSPEEEMRVYRDKRAPWTFKCKQGVEVGLNVATVFSFLPEVFVRRSSTWINVGSSARRSVTGTVKGRLRLKAVLDVRVLDTSK
jgi:hypothetical protein